MDLELAPVRLLDVVETALMLCSDSASNKRLDLCYWCQPSACATFLLDATRVQQILLNYLSNAIKVRRTHQSVTDTHECSRLLLVCLLPLTRVDFCFSFLLL